MCHRNVKLCSQMLPSFGFHLICGMVVTPNHLKAFYLKIWHVKLPGWDCGRMFLFLDVVECHIIFPYSIGPLGTPRTVYWDIAAWIRSQGLAGSCIGKLYKPLTSRVSMIDGKRILTLLQNNLTWWSQQQTETTWLILSVNGGVMYDVSGDVCQELWSCYKDTMATWTRVIA